MVLILTCNIHLLSLKIGIKQGHYEAPLPRVVFKRVYKIIDFISKVLISNYAKIRAQYVLKYKKTFLCGK